MAPFFSYFFLRLAGEKINQVSLVNITSVAMFMFSIPGTFVLFFQLDEYRFNTGVDNPELVLEVLIFSFLNIVAFLLGVIFCRKMVGLEPVPVKRTDFNLLTCTQEHLVYILFAVCLLILILYISKLDKLAIIVSLTEGVNAAKEARSAMGNAFQGGKYHWYSLVMHDIGNLVTFTSFASWLLTKKRKSGIVFFITLCYSVFVAVMATEKAPIVWLAIGLFMVFFFVKKGGYIPFRIILPFTITSLAVLVVLYIYFMGSKDSGSAIWSVFSRTFSGSISPSYFYLEFFPNHQDYLLGRTFPNPGGIMPFEPYSYTIEVMNWIFPELSKSGIVGTAPTVFWGEAYANFGPFGVPIIAFIVGNFVAMLSYFVSRLEINPLTIGYLIWLILLIKDLSVTGFSGYFYNIYIIVISTIVMMLIQNGGYIFLRRNDL